MSNKTITISVHEDDMRRLALASLAFIHGRFLSKYSNKMEEIENLIKEDGTKSDIVQNVQDLINTLQESCQELTKLEPFIREFDD